MRRRQFVIGGAGAVAFAPRFSVAQQAKLPVIGMLDAHAPDRIAPLVAAFKQSLAKSGYDDGRNVRIVLRSGHGHIERLPELARELVANNVDIIVATPTASAVAARAVTKTIPIVFSVADDPVRLGLVNSFPRPGGNATGVYFLLSDLAGKQFSLLKELLPGSSNFGLLFNPDNVNAKSVVADTAAAASGIGAKITLVEASDIAAIDAAFASLAEKKIAALLVAADPFLFGRRAQLAAISTRLGIAAIFNVREYAQAGGLISYGTSLSDVYRQVGDYTARILHGAKPADLPVVQPTKFELVINLATAMAIGLEVPPTLLARADEVIE